VPTVLVIGPYRFFFYSNEFGEPPHIDVERDTAVAKFWLSPVALARSRGFPAQELTRLSRLVTDHHDQFQESWDEYFGD
jgi:hypothetical protein